MINSYIAFNCFGRCMSLSIFILQFLDTDYMYHRSSPPQVYDALKVSPLFTSYWNKVYASSSSKEGIHTPVKKVVGLAWRLVTMPCPIIVRQPAVFDRTCMDEESCHWNPKAKNNQLVYTEPVVYRSYNEKRHTRKGLVGNIPMTITKHSGQPLKQCVVC